MPEEPIARDAYDELAEAFAGRVDEKPHNAHLERPATLALLPEVDGRRVLDAGCGPGLYAEWLLDRGADVVAIDASAEMVAQARDRVGDRATVRQADLAEPLDAGDGAFDVVLSALAIDHVRDFEHVFGEFARVLRPDGTLVVSLHHPFDAFRAADDADYFAVERVSEVWTTWGDPVEVPSYRRPLGAVVSPLLSAGLRLDDLVEPTPTEAFREHDPAEYAALSRRPSFLCLRATLPDGGSSVP